MRYGEQTILDFNGEQYFKQKIIPSIPLSETDIYIITNVGDRLDLLAFNYYSNVNDWWIIAAANNNITKGSIYPKPGTQLRIPINIDEVKSFINNYKR